MNGVSTIVKLVCALFIVGLIAAAFGMMVVCDRLGICFKVQFVPKSVGVANPPPTPITQTPVPTQTSLPTSTPSPTASPTALPPTATPLPPATPTEPAPQPTPEATQVMPVTPIASQTEVDYALSTLALFALTLLALAVILLKLNARRTQQLREENDRLQKERKAHFEREAKIYENKQRTHEFTITQKYARNKPQQQNARKGRW